MVLANLWKLVSNPQGKEQEIQVDWCVSFTYPRWNIIVNAIMLFYCHFQALKWRTASVGEADSIRGETVNTEAPNTPSAGESCPKLSCPSYSQPHHFVKDFLYVVSFICLGIYLMDFILAHAYCLFLFKMATPLSLCHNFRCVFSQWVSVHSGQITCTFWLADKIKNSGSSMNTETH